MEECPAPSDLSGATLRPAGHGLSKVPWDCAPVAHSGHPPFIGFPPPQAHLPLPSPQFLEPSPNILLTLDPCLRGCASIPLSRVLGGNPTSRGSVSEEASLYSGLSHTSPDSRLPGRVTIAILTIIMASTHWDPERGVVVPRPQPRPLHRPSLQRAERPEGQR